MRLSLRTLLFGTAIIACFCSTAVYCLGPVLPGATIRHLEPGIPESEVVELLGASEYGGSN